MNLNIHVVKVQNYPVKIEPDFRKALDDIYLQEGSFLITGSLYFISEVRKYLLQKIHSKY